MIKFMRLSMLLIVTVSLLSACGGSSGSSSATATGKFIDAPVVGLPYVSGGQTGVTGPNGEFTYEVGNTIKFTVGGIVLGEVPAQAIITPVQSCSS